MFLCLAADTRDGRRRGEEGAARGCARRVALARPPTGRRERSGRPWPCGDRAVRVPCLCACLKVAPCGLRWTVRCRGTDVR